MGNGRYISDKRDVKAGCLEGTQGSFSAGSWSFYVHLNVLHPMFLRFLGGVIRSKLRCKGRTLAGALKTLTAGTGPGYGVAIHVSDGNDRVVKR
jgi:hypothetical protein